MVDDNLLDEQLKKKKRLVLLALLILLLATTLAALPWLQETSSPATAVAEKGSPPPTSTETVATPVRGTIPEPDISPIGQKTAVLSGLTPESLLTNPAPTSPVPTSTPTQETTPVLAITAPTDTATPAAIRPAATAVTRKTPTITKTPTDVHANEWPEVGTPLAGDNSEPVPIEATRKSPRWDGPELPDPTVAVSPTQSKDTDLVPPDGLPVTGINLPRKTNWVALGMMVLLLGAGVAALLHSEAE